jgi:hypothetical protein
VVAAPRPVTAVTQGDPELESLRQIPLSEPTSEDVFSKPNPAVPRTPVASPTALTDPRRPAVTRDEAAAAQGEGGMVFASASVDAPATPSVVVADDMPAPVVKKKKVKRLEPLPSEGSGLLVSETRREKTMITELPSIVIEDE